MKYPPKRFLSIDREKSAVAPAGPRARRKLMTVCARPFVAPSTSGPAAAAVIKIKMAPRIRLAIQIVGSNFKGTMLSRTVAHLHHDAAEKLGDQ